MVAVMLTEMSTVRLLYCNARSNGEIGGTQGNSKEKFPDNVTSYTVINLLQHSQIKVQLPK